MAKRSKFKVGGVEFGQVPERDALRGPTVGDNHRHAIVRFAFLAEMEKDEPVRALYSKWRADAGLAQPAQDLRSALDRGTKCSETIDVTPYFEAYVSAVARFLNGRDTMTITEDTLQFVRSLDLHWGWLPLELQQRFVVGLVGEVYEICDQLGVTDFAGFEWKFKIVERVPTEPIVVTFQPEAGESLSEQRARIVKEAERILESSARSRVPLGSIPRLQVATLERYAQWYYRHAIRGESERSIARELWPDDDRRKDVHYGVQRARELLEHGVYELD